MTGEISRIVNSLLAERWSLAATESDLEDIIPSPVTSSHQYSAPLFASIKPHRKSWVSLFGGWSSASFTDIRASLCRWVMDPLRWYVLLWWLQRLEYRLGSLHQAITEQLFCYTKTSRRSPTVPQTPRFPNSPTSSNCKPTSPRPPPSPLDPLAPPWNQTRMTGSKQHRPEDLEYVSLTLVLSAYIVLE